ncbi:MAG: hypothetical protein JST00_16820 [Deltaproteobacteria bacterium]|nr:hypothetical protein [Deltaproteobacteria bacterium]
MIGRSLNERFVLGLVPGPRAIALLEEAMATQSRRIVDIRAQGATMIAVLFVNADRQAVKLCRELGMSLAKGATAVMGLEGEDAARLFPSLPEAERSWLREPCGARETKVLLISGGRAPLSLTIADGKVTVTAVSQGPS